MRRSMTKKDAYALFMQDMYPLVVAKYGRDDRVAIREKWNNYVDALNKDGEVTDKQAYNWSNPFLK